ncbi:MAG: glycosyltransferase family 1 protein [Gammaproteobacteria bacterium]|nr:glycosyltransferase family 1 protein [Gammaproteobacteria bacterium]
MRLFQNSGISRTYRHRLNALADNCGSFSQRRKVFLSDRYGAPHFLAPVLDSVEWAFFTNGDDEIQQRMWASERGLSPGSALEDILLAQIEDHRSEIFYNLDPIRFGSGFVKRLPRCVKKSVCWRAAPASDVDLTGYDLVVSNFPSINRQWETQGCRTALFFPAHDPILDSYACNVPRPIDVLFVGGYTRYHRQRARVLEKVAEIANGMTIVYCLDSSRPTQIAESLIGHLLPVKHLRRPIAIRKVSRPPVFGIDLYRILSQSKIVLNGAVDMAQAERGNMRCFEAMGARCLLLSDAGRYPAGLVEGGNLLTYESGDDAVKIIRACLKQGDVMDRIAAAGYSTVSSIYSKTAQWSAFNRLL